MPAPFRLGFNLPFADAIAAARARKVELPEDYYADSMRAVRRTSFTVSHLATLNQVKAVRDSLTEAIARGESFAAWKRSALQQDWGLSPARLEMVFRTNVQTAYSTGHWRAFQEGRARRPYLMYSAINDSRVRPTHLAMDGHIAPINDPVWQKWTPPCGYQCRCTQISLNESQAKARGYGRQIRPDVEPDPGFGGFDPGSESDRLARRWNDARTNAGPGLDQAARDLDARRPKLDDEVGRTGWAKPTAGQLTWRDLGRPDLRRVPDGLRLEAPEILPVAVTREAALEQLAKAVGISTLVPTVAIATPVETAILRLAELPHMVEKIEDARERYANFVLPTLHSPFEVWAVRYDDSGVRNRYVGLFRGNRGLLVVVRVNLDGSLVWNVMNAPDKRLNDARLGTLIFKKGR